MDITRGEADLAVSLWGKEAQEATLIEEMGEFLQAWNKLKRGKITEEEYVSEIADVYIMIQQMIHIYSETFDKVYPVKLKKIRDKFQKYLQVEVNAKLRDLLRKELNEELECRVLIWISCRYSIY